MKKLIISIVLLLAIIAGAQAQSRQSQLSEEQKQELKQRMDEYKTKLNLSEAQQSQVEGINIEFLEALEKIRNSDGTRLSKYKKFKQAGNEKDKKMKSVLSSSQYKIYKEQQEAFREEIKAYRQQR